MPFKKRLAALTKISPEKLPSSYQIIGNVLLLKMPKIKTTADKRHIALAIRNLLPYVKTVCEIKGVSGELRRPSVKILIGEKTETIHRENGVLYKLDPAKIMFSKGNLSERKRILSQIKQGEVIVDMFAGIGYFSLGLSKFTKAKKIYSIEKNITAYKYLLENIKLNKAIKIEPIKGDCRQVMLPEKADRIFMGYFPGTIKFFPYALEFLKNKGMIHYHDIFSKKELWEKPLRILESIAKERGFKLKVLEKKIVKSYAPDVYHIVLDCQADRIVK